jgi:predicted TIM-barrel fold metal-dependent hydrolase
MIGGAAVTNAVEVDDFPLMVSVDDHVVEPPTLWTDRIASRFRDEVPHVVKELVPSLIKPGTEKWADVWYYGSARVETHRGFAAVGFDSEAVEGEAMTFDEMRPGCYEVSARLSDMDADGVEASVCFPNALVRFCGQRFLEAENREVALLCVRAYNDWLVEEWSGPSEGRLLGAGIIPLWDAELAADEVRRIAAQGCTSVCFSEIPARLGLPSMYSGYWDPFFAACAETDTVINLHIGSSSVVHTTSSDAPYGVRISNHFGNSAFSLTDWLICGAFLRFPNLRVAFSEGQAGWIPYLLSRLDGLWRGRSPLVGFDALPEPPSHYLPGHVFACIFDDPIAIELLPLMDENGICFETDYPHNDSSWPDSKEGARRLTAGLSTELREKILRLNGARLYRVERVLREPALGQLSSL